MSWSGFTCCHLVLSKYQICTALFSKTILCVWVCSWWPQRPEKGIRSRGTGVTSDCEQVLGTELLEVFWKSSKYSEPLSHIYCPKVQILCEGLWSILNWCLCRVRDRNLVSFYVWLVRFFILICSLWRYLCLLSGLFGSLGSRNPTAA